MRTAGFETKAWMQSRGISEFDYEDEPAIRNQVDAFWNESYREALAGGPEAQ
jgi:hypothetical protein